MAKRRVAPEDYAIGHRGMKKGTTHNTLTKEEKTMHIGKMNCRTFK
jgi:hypothetical protein